MAESQNTPTNPSATASTRAALGRTVAEAGRRFVHGWLPVTLLLTVFSFLAGLVATAALAAVQPVALAQVPILFNPDGSGISTWGMVLLAIQIGLPAFLIIAWIAAIAFGTSLRLFDSVRDGGRPLFGRTLLQAVRRSPALLIALALHLVMIVLSLVLTPFFMVVGLIGLIVTGVQRARGRTARVPVGYFVAALIPLGALAVVIVRFALAATLTVLEGGGPLRALRRSWAATGRSMLPAALAIILSFVAYFALQFGISLLLGELADDPLIMVGVVIVQSFTFGYPLAVLAVLGRELRDDDVAIEPLPHAWRRGLVAATATALSLVMFVTSGAVTPAYAGEDAASGVEWSEPPADTGTETSPTDGPLGLVNALSGEGGAEGEDTEGGTEEGGSGEGSEEPGGSGEQGPSRVAVDDPRFEATLIVREGSSTVHGDPVTLWVTATSTDATPVVSNFSVTYFLLGADEQWRELGTNQYSGWYGASSFEIDLLEHPLPPGSYRFGAQVLGELPSEGVPPSNLGPWLEVAHTVAAGVSSTVTTLVAPQQVRVDAPIPVEVSVTSGGEPVTKGWVRVRLNNLVSVPDLWLPLGTDGVASGDFMVPAVGSAQLEASYFGAPPLLSSTSPAVTVDIAKIPVAVGLTQSATTTSFGDPVTFDVTLVAGDGGSLGSGVPVQLRLDDPDSGAVLETAWPDINGLVSITTTALPAGSSLIYAVYNPSGGDSPRYARSVSAPVAHGTGVVPVTFTIESAEGDSLYRGERTDLLIDAVVPAGSPGLTDGVITVIIGTEEYILDDYLLPLGFQATMTGDSVDVTVSLQGSSSHAAATDAQLTLTRRASATTVSIMPPQAALPGTAHTVAFGVAGENPYLNPTTGAFEYRVDGGAWSTVAAQGAGASIQLVLDLGRHTIDARYLTDDATEFESSPIASRELEVGLVPTTVSGTAPGVRVGESIDVAVEVSAAAWLGAPTTGSISLEDAAGTVLGTAALNGTSVALVSIPARSAGAHELTARFSGNDQYAASSSPVTVAVGLWPTTLTLVGPGETTAYAPTTYTATVGADAAAPVPLAGGLVTFTTNGGLELGTATLDANGVATHEALLPFSSSVQQVFATYTDPAGVFASSSDMKLTLALKASTSLTLEYLPTNPAPGQEVQIRVTVSVDSPSRAPLGNGYLIFSGDFFPTGFNLQPGADGVATYTVAAPPPGGPNPYTAVQFTGSDHVSASYASGYLTSRKANVSVVVTPPAGEVNAGVNPVVRVSVISEAGATAPNHGTVTLRSGSTVLGTQTLSASTAMPLDFTVDATALGLGTHSLVAEYTGGPHFEAGASDAAQLVLVGYETGVLLTATPQHSSTLGDTVIVTASVDALGYEHVPVGQVRFEVDGVVVGTEPLVPVGGTGPGSDRAAATLTVPPLAIGEHSIRAVYVPSSTAFAGSTSAPLTHTVEGKEASVWPQVPQLITGRQAAIGVTVSSLSGTGYPLGTVELWLDGTPTGITATLLPDSPNTTTSTLTVPGTALQVGDRQLSVRYTPDDGVHSPAQFGGLTTVYPNTPAIAVNSTSPAEVLWGTEVFVTVTVGRDATDTLAQVPLPTGAPTVALLGGPECTNISGPLYSCTADRVGPMTLSVSYPGDTRYTAASRDEVIAQAIVRTPLLTVTLSTSAPETGALVTLDWSLVGPGVRPQISGLPAGAQCTGDAVGSCEFRYTLADASSAQPITVEYARTALWAEARWSQQVNPIACYPVARNVSPTGAGAVAIETAANCVDGGYRAGTPIVVRVTAADTGSPAQRWRLIDIGGRLVADPAPALHFFEVGPAANQTQSVSAIFELRAECVTVTNVMSNMRHNYGGQMFVGGMPNCPGDDAWSVTSAPNAHGGRDVSWTGRFLVGTAVSSDRPTAISGYEYYGVTVDGGAYQPKGAVTRTLDRDLRVVSLFGPVCYPIDVEFRGPGTAYVTGPTQASRCPDPARADQFAVGGTVLVLMTPDPSVPLAYPSSVEGLHRAAVSLVGENIGRLGSGTTERSFVVESAGRITVEFATCAVLTVVPQFKGYASGTVTTSAKSNCPVGPTSTPASTWHLTPGTSVNLSAVPEQVAGFGARFAKWNIPGIGDNATLAFRNTFEHLSLQINEDTVLRPSFVQDFACSEFRSQVHNSEIELRLEFSADALGFCDEGILGVGEWSQNPQWGKVTSGTVTGHVRAVSGDPLLGWRLKHPDLGTYGVPGSEVTMSLRDRAGYAGALRLDAFACQRVLPFVTIVDVAGNPHTALQQTGDYIQISPAPNCPYDSTAWIVGTDLTFTAGADARGYAFANWEGVAGGGTEKVGESYRVNAAAPEAAVMAVYDLICDTLTITGKPHRVTRLPEANCNGAAAPTSKDDVWTGSYIGGTSVALFGEVPGGNVWQGWAGDVEKTGKVDVAVVVMDGDKTVAHRYREKSWDEKAADFFSEAGNQLAIAAKKVVGVAGFAANQAFSYVPPFNAVGPVLGGLSKVGDVLEELGVSESVTKYFSYPGDTFKWVTDQYLCVAAWGLSGGSASVYLGDYTAPIEDWMMDNVGEGIGAVGGVAPIGAIGGPMNPIGDIDPDNPGEGLDDAWGDIGDGAGLAELGGADLGKVGSGLGYLDTALTGYKLLTNPQGLGWDNNASDAWSYDNFNERMSGCSSAAMPDFLREEIYPDRTEEEWAEIEKKYGGL
ncbi:MAG: Ig-like domain repeat protein [Cryobacterium sp.]|nr:Ig-like domain repeat protein [Cryobacterium sp.]